MAEIRIEYHRDTELFRAALIFTAAQTGFSERLIEKDYYCSIALADLCASDATEIVFKGGTCLSKAYAEKLRAALSRREPAIRDFFDLNHAFSEGTINEIDPLLIQLLKDKLTIPGNGAMDVSNNKLTLLKAQLDTDLRPVIRDDDFDQFDLERVFQRIADLTAKL